MKILFYLGHPAHFHLFKESISRLKYNGQRIIILIKQKDVLEELLKETGWEYLNIYPKERKNNKLSIAFSLIKRDYEVLRIVIKTKPNLMIGTSAEITHIGKLLNIPSIVVNEDDADQVPLFAKLAYPFADVILTPLSCENGKWEYKTIKYDGYHELCYLHPNYFSPNQSIISELKGSCENYFIIRLAKLSAHHDAGKTGLYLALLTKIINRIKTFGRVYITSERTIENELEEYRINIKPSQILDAMSGASLYIGDSQTMAAEAAVLGTPSIRFNDFVGKLGYLEELEHKYGLTYGIKTSEPEKLLEKIEELTTISDIKKEWDLRRKKMLMEKIDVSAFMVWFIENYPESLSILRKNPDYQFQFK